MQVTCGSGDTGMLVSFEVGEPQWVTRDDEYEWSTKLPAVRVLKERAAPLKSKHSIYTQEDNELLVDLRVLSK